jgi:hypothetical protein
MPCPYLLKFRFPAAGRVDQRPTRRDDFGIETDQAIALSAGLTEASSPLTSDAGRGGLNR